jgi:transposase
MASRSDARKLDAAALAHVRRSLVQAVRGGMRQTEAARVFGVSLRAANKWVALDKDGGLRALKLKRRGRRAGEGRLNAARAKRIRQMIIDALPDQLKLPFYLWTRAAVVSLIEREYEITVSLTTVGRYLKSWGMSPQKPVRRAYERNDAAIARWLRQEYPAIARQAKQEKAVIYWGDEMGLRSDHVTGTSYSLLGQTPLVRATGQRFGCNMISAITNRGHLAFMVFHGKFDGRLFVQFMQRLLKQAAGKVYLIVDGPLASCQRICRGERATVALDPNAGLLPGAQPRRASQPGCENERLGKKSPEQPRGNDDRRAQSLVSSPTTAANHS